MGRAIAYGLAGGGIVVATMFLVYSQSRATYLSPVFQWSLTLIYLAFMVLVLLRRPPYTKFDALKAAFVAYLCISACYFLYNFALYEVFDPELYGLQSELMIENAIEYEIGAPGTIGQSPEQLYAVANLRQGFGSMTLSYAQSAIYGFAGAFLLGQLLGRREGPGAAPDNKAAGRNVP